MPAHSDPTIDALAQLYVEHRRGADEVAHWRAERDEEGEWRLVVTFVSDGLTLKVPMSPALKERVQAMEDAAMRNAVQKHLQPSGLPPS